MCHGKSRKARKVAVGHQRSRTVTPLSRVAGSRAVSATERLSCLGT